MKLLTKNWFLILILLSGAFLRLYRLDDLMPFIADQGWYYISARDMLLTGEIPLVGITSSHTWLHQGAYWTYFLAIIFKLFNFNPIVPAYAIALLGVTTIALVYHVAKEMFNQKVALVAAFIYATSPLIVMDSRFAYHTSPIPFFTALLIISVHRWVGGNLKYFPFIILLLGILYNLEIATFSLVGIVFLILTIGFWKKEKWSRELLNLKTGAYSLIAFLVTMLPMLIYDFSHGFPQTIKVVVWVFYRVAVFIGYPPLNPNAPGESWATFFPFAFDLVQKMIFLPSKELSLVLYVIPILSLGYIAFKKRKKPETFSVILILSFVIIPTLAYIAAKTNSSAYLLIFYPQVAILLGVFFTTLIKGKVAYLIILAVVVGGFINSCLLVKGDFLTGPSFEKRVEAANKIIKEADGEPYNIIGKGQGSIYESFIMPHEYLTWWLGKESSNKSERTRFYVSEYIDRIVVERAK